MGVEGRLGHRGCWRRSCEQRGAASAARVGLAPQRAPGKEPQTQEAVVSEASLKGAMNKNVSSRHKDTGIADMLKHFNVTKEQNL